MQNISFFLITTTFVFYFQTQSFSQTIDLGGYLNYGYTNAMNSEIPEVYYETSGKNSYNFGVILSYKKRIHTLELEFGYSNLGYSTKKTQGFTPSNEFPVIERLPIYFFDKLNYNYTQLGIKYFYSIVPKVQLGLGLHPSIISNNSVVIDREVLIAGQTNVSDTIYGSYNRIIDNYDNFNEYNLFSSLNLNYKLSKYLLVNISYTVSLFNFNRYAENKKMYHQNFLTGLKFVYPLK